MKNKIFIFVGILLIVSIPIYAAGRLYAPQAIISVVEEHLPKNLKLGIRSYETTANLNIIYKDVELSSQNGSLKFETLSLLPRLSIQSPIILKSPLVIIKNSQNIVNLKNLEIKVIPSRQSLSNFSYSGTIKSLTSHESLLIDGIHFIVSEFGNAKPKIEMNADSFDIKYVSPFGDVLVNLEEASILIDNQDDILAVVTGKKLNIDLSKLWYENEARKLFGNDVRLELNPKKIDAWSIPLDFRATDVRSVGNNLSKSLKLRADANWQLKSSECNFSQLFSDNIGCGKMVDVVNVKLVLSDKIGDLIFAGDGFCVAPRSGCPQRINAVIRSKNTTEIFSKFMLTGLINPLVGGIILGGLLSSPSTNERSYDHEAKFDVLGSQIFLNNQPLIR